MARQKSLRGLQFRGGTWIIDKRIRGRRVCESTGESQIEKAEEFLARRIEEIRQAEIFGVRPKRTWRQAATKYLNEVEKRSKRGDATQLELLDPYIGDLPIEAVHMGTPQLQRFIADRKRLGRKRRTLNCALEVIRHILNLAAGEWMDEHGLTWLHHAPKIRLFPLTDKRSAYPLDWSEQMRLFNQLPPHLVKMALFTVNTGCREQEVCGLRWDWEVPIPELETSVFLIPGDHVKNQQERLVVLNRVAKAVTEEMRRVHPEYVFAYRGKPVGCMNSTAWRSARKRAGLPQVRVHDLKHTYGRRLRAAGVSEEDRKDLLGHKSGRSMTTHYSMPDVEGLITASNAVCGENLRKSHAIVILKRRPLPSPSQQVSEKTG